jgi:hypothetical protein
MSDDKKTFMPAPSAIGRATAIILAVAAVTVGSLVYASHSTARSPDRHQARAPHTAAGCGRAHGPFTESGAVVRQRDGAPFVPYGITVPGLAHADYQQYLPKDEAQIAAAARSWCASTVQPS